MAVGRYMLTALADIDAVATLFEAELNISLAEVIGHQAEDGLTNAPATEIASVNEVLIEVTGTAEVDITNAATAVGGVELVGTIA